MHLGGDYSADEVLKAHTLCLLKRFKGNRTRTAQVLNWCRQTLATYMKKWGLESEFKDPNPPDSQPPTAG
jgi:DNA-binding NtrC family response regulator